VNPDIIGLWTGEFDLNTLRMDGEIFESGKKKLRIQKHPDTCGRGLKLPITNTRLTAIYSVLQINLWQRGHFQGKYGAPEIEIVASKTV